MTKNRGWKYARLGLLTVALVLAVTFVCQAATVTGLMVTKSDEKVEIHVNASSSLYYQVKSVSKPRQALVVQMPSATTLKSALRTVQIDKGIIERARLEEKGGQVNLVVEVLQPTKYYIQAAPGGSGLVLVMSTQTVTAKQAKAVPKMAAGKPTVEAPEPVEPEPPKTVVKTQSKVSKVAYQHKNLMARRRAARTQKRVYIKPVKLVSIDFVNADLIYVLKLLAKELNVNLVTDATVTGSVTMSLKDVSAQTAMNIIIQMNGFSQKKMGNILFVGSAETMAKLTPDIITYQPTADARAVTIQLDNISSDDAIKAVKTTYPMVYMAATPQGNGVIVQASGKLLGDIKTLVKGIDVPAPEAPPTPQEKVEVVKLKYALAADVANTLKTLLGSEAPANMEIDARLNALVMKGYDQQIAAAKKQLEDIDIPLQQVMLAVKVVDLSETGAKNLGVSWTVGAGDGTQPLTWYENTDPNSTTFVAQNIPPIAQTAYAVPTYTDLPIGFFTRSPFVLQSALATQITQGDAKVLASPRVATMSGKKAEIHIGDKYPIVYYDPRAGQYQVIYVDIGIKLAVTPVVSPDGFVVTDINTTVSDLRELVNNQYPRTTERSANLMIRVKDNNTIVIGGMVNESVRTSMTKVPLLGDIPVLGLLFKTKATDKSKGEVVIMITPKIMNN